MRLRHPHPFFKQSRDDRTNMRVVEMEMEGGVKLVANTTITDQPDQLHLETDDWKLIFI